MSLFYSTLRRHQFTIVLIFLILLSAVSFWFYFQNGQHLRYGDSVSRLNISRKIIDNITPGLAQIGNVWLPLPMLIMLPFTWNSYLWQSGIAGAIMSMSAYVIGGIYLYKSAKILTQSFFASIFATAIYALNINILYFQTTAMSEVIFVSAFIIAIYHLIAWVKDDLNILHLIYAGAAIGATTLIRYEGLALLFSSIPMIAFYVYIKHRSYKKVESRTILFATVAMLGFALWTIYLTAIFGDPLYWKNVYLSEELRSTSRGEISGYTFNLNLWQASWKYITAVVWMNGVIPTVFAVISIPLAIYHAVKNRSFYYLPLIVAFSVFLFMVLTLQRNTPINQPFLNIANITNPKTNDFREFNIRYGLLMIPLVALLCSYLFAVRFVVLKMLLVVLFVVQIYSYFQPVYSVIYQIPLTNNRALSAGGLRSLRYVQWMKKNYNKGYIMVSALKHDPQMFQMGFNYKTYIHEGTGKYWKDSQRHPQRYASWVIMDYYNDNDQVTKYLKDSRTLDSNFNLVYSKEGIRIYKIKTKPERMIE